MSSSVYHTNKKNVLNIACFNRLYKIKKQRLFNGSGRTVV